ncbi:hypothetical protein [Desulfatitalea tepidiphila]|uniref:hypothetical protein n=1 Tax=Desulfatitalea tepidiphila TaxID=1185843 RepID=UPI00128F1B2F|nr:hypothetical protein [Desulfatitalea tepidiphila]
MNDRFRNLVMIGFRKYVEFAQALGKGYLCSQLLINGKLVGARSKKHCYVDPATYAKIFGKRPSNALPEYFYNRESKKNYEPDLLKSNQDKVKCPKCRSLMNPGNDQSGYSYKCSKCGNKY